MLSLHGQFQVEGSVCKCCISAKVPSPLALDVASLWLCMAFHLEKLKNESLGRPGLLPTDYPGARTVAGRSL